MKRVLLNIDYTNDFIATNGALTCGEAGQSIEAAIVSITNKFIQNGEDIIFTIDVHDEGDTYHPETKLFPPHNLRNTNGRMLYGQLQQIYEESQDRANIHWLDKTRYSAFAGTTLDMMLRARGIEEVYLVGVCTDICILHTAVDLYNLGYRIVVVKDAVASFNQAGHEWALGHFQHTLGATIS
ncbi:cysteine hydrolase family protein [Paenibacillus endoradicis]|uniref:cysteine hydrolase family protein n=1 Tax=Paenibacillus endoradicis TaxID=2972487 RepID=UPI00215961B3|nr:isochorismatase family cysteine hydrolase [Paenibacillus endoradicis]MCR8656529.1 cysteine hydrolase [Paenibacillus endoradicis]